MLYLLSREIIVADDRLLKGTKAGFFGGFCSCGGEYKATSFFRDRNHIYVLRECECGSMNVLVFDPGSDRVYEHDTRKLDKKDFLKALSHVFTDSELKALISKLKGDKYSYSAFSRARKKLEDAGFSLSDFEVIIS